MRRTPTGPVIADLVDKKYSSDSLLKAISQQSSTTSERSREHLSESEMSCSEEDDESFSQEEASQEEEEESIDEEVKSMEEAPSLKTEELNIPKVVVIKP